MAAPSNDSNRNDYKLSCTLCADGDSVRSLAYNPSTHRLLSGSQEGGLSSFAVSTSNPQSSYTPDLTLHPESNHSHAITALLSILDDFSSPIVAGGYVTGCKDHLLRVFAPSHELTITLQGHSNAVTSLSWLRLSDSSLPPLLVSGSWDGCAKLWDLVGATSGDACRSTLDGHENTTSVLGLPPPSNSCPVKCALARLATGSAGFARGDVICDHAIRLWGVELSLTEEGRGPLRVQCTHIVSNDHAGPIRAISYDSCLDAIVSCSNDGTVKIRNVHTGVCEHTLMYPSFAYTGTLPPMFLNVATLSMASDGDGNTTRILACTADGHVLVWTGNRNGSFSDHPQILPHPDTVWTLHTLPDRDFATACADGKIRIFTTDPERQGSLEDVAVLESAVLESRNMPSTEELAKLPVWGECHVAQEHTDGQVKVFNKMGRAVAAQWSESSCTWIEVGDVIGRNDENENDHVPENEEGGIDHVLPIQVYQHLPMKGYRSFEVGADTRTLGKVFRKVLEFHSDLACKDTAITSFTHETLDGLCATLCATSRYHATCVSHEELQVVATMLQEWPLSHVFPALDLARLVVLHPDAAKADRKDYWMGVVDAALEACTKVLDGTLGKTDASMSIVIPMLVMRLLVNCFRGGRGSLEAVALRLGRVLTCAQGVVASHNKNIRLAIATLLLNVTSYLHQQSCHHDKFGETDVPDKIFTIVEGIIRSGLYETEAMVRVLVALGTTLLVDDAFRQKYRILQLASVVQHVGSSYGEEVHAVLTEIQMILKV